MWQYPRYGQVVVRYKVRSLQVRLEVQAEEQCKQPGEINRGMTDGPEDQTLKNTFTLEGLTQAARV